jgi:hypothetical protein
MNQFCFAFALVVLLGAAAPAWADAPPRLPDDAAGGWREQDCGGDAFSYAEVVSRRDGRDAGAIVVVPDTLCAELARRAPAVPSLHIHVEPSRPLPPEPRKPEPRP